MIHPSSDNTGPRHTTDVAEFSFIDFDALPRELRDALNYAPFNLSSAPFVQARNARWTTPRILLETRIALANVIHSETPHIWGKEYPCRSSFLIESAFKDIPASPTCGEPSARAAGKPSRAARRTPVSRALRTSTKRNRSQWK